MKKTLLATIVTSLFLVGCGGGSNNSNTVTETVKTSSLTVFDGAINGMDASFSCDDHGKIITGTSEKSSDGYGNVTIKNTFFAENPEKCTVTFKASPQGAIDMSNGKKMDNVVYSIPKGMMEPGKPAAATPFSTLIAKKMASTNGNGVIDYTTAKNTVFETMTSALGTDASALTADTFEAFLSTPSQTLKTLGTDAPKVSQLIIAQTAVISDVLVATKSDTTLSVEDITKSSAALAANIVKENTFFPYSSADKKEIKQVIIPVKDITADKIESIAEAPETAAETITVELKPVVTDTLPEATNPPIKPQPVKPTPPATGGTGNDNANI